MDQWHRVAVGCAWVGAHSCSTHAHIRMRPWRFEEELSTRWDGVLLNCPEGLVKQCLGCVAVATCCVTALKKLGRPDLSLQPNVFLPLAKTCNGKWCSYAVMCHQERTCSAMECLRAH